MSWSLALLERDLLPDALIRLGIRRLLRRRLAEETRGGDEAVEQRQQRLVEELRAGPVAVHTADANAQHYELPTEFFRCVLGRHLKYSGGWWPDGVGDLDASEEAMLALSCERAGVADGQEILDLGCGWGSMTLYLASRFPAARILGVSNSHGQRQYVMEHAQDRGLGNVEVVTADMNDFDPGQHAPGRRFDRVVSIEMLEHMRNYHELFRRIAGWLHDDGRVFVHVFCHHAVAYPFEVRDDSDWMARFFFTGGMMPSFDLFRRFSDHLVVEEDWRVSGRHYRRTAEAWLARMDDHRAELWPVLERTYGVGEAGRWWVYWRVFFMACAELFGFRGGAEWLVGHYRLAQSRQSTHEPNGALSAGGSVSFGSVRVESPRRSRESGRGLRRRCRTTGPRTSPRPR